jgi:competence protein ComEA
MKRINTVIVLFACIILSSFIIGVLIGKDFSTEDKNINTNTNVNINNLGSNGPETKINVNTADKNELMSIEGIGDKRASSIINNRPYVSIWDIEKAGISEDFIKKNEGRLTV